IIAATMTFCGFTRRRNVMELTSISLLLDRILTWSMRYHLTRPICGPYSTMATSALASDTRGPSYHQFSVHQPRGSMRWSPLLPRLAHVKVRYLIQIVFNVLKIPASSGECGVRWLIRAEPSPGSRLSNPNYG